MTVKVDSNTVSVYTDSEDWQAAADEAAQSRPFKRHFYAAVDPSRINPKYEGLLDEANHIKYTTTPLTLSEAKKLDVGIVTSDDEFDYSDNEVVFYQHTWVFTNGFPN